METLTGQKLYFNYAISYLLGFITVLITIKNTVNIVGGHYIQGVFLLLCLSLFGSYLAYNLLKLKFHSRLSLAAHILWGLVAAVIVTLVVSTGLFALNSIVEGINLHVYTLFVYLAVHLAVGCFYSAPGVLISGVTLGLLNFKLTSKA